MKHVYSNWEIENARIKREKAVKKEKERWLNKFRLGELIVGMVDARDYEQACMEMEDYVEDKLNIEPTAEEQFYRGLDYCFSLSPGYASRIYGNVEVAYEGVLLAILEFEYFESEGSMFHVVSAEVILPHGELSKKIHLVNVTTVQRKSYDEPQKYSIIGYNKTHHDLTRLAMEELVHKLIKQDMATVGKFPLDWIGSNG